MKTSHILLVDETGIDGISKKIIYVGCLIDKAQITEIYEKIKKFNREMLDKPSYSRKKSWVNHINEPRHFSQDHKTLREFFVDQVLSTINCRLYACLINYDDAKLLECKKQAMKKLIDASSSTRFITRLEIIAEDSEKAFKKAFQDVSFKGKDFLPLSIPDYYAGMLGSFHRLRVSLANGEKISQDEASFDLRFYEGNVNKIAYEHDLSEGIISSRKRGRLFLEEFKSKL